MSDPVRSDRLRGKVAIVTGAGRGVGRGIALALAEEGADVAIAEIDAATASSTAADLELLGVRSIAVPCDVSERGQVEECVGATVDQLGTVDVLVNNAHYLENIDIPIIDLSADDLRRQFDSGVLGTLFFMQECFPHLRDGGRIVNVASAAGVAGFESFGAYAAAKEAIRALTRVAAREWGRVGINVNCVCPSVPTEATTAWRAKHGIVTDYSSRPIPRPGSVEDVGGVVKFLVGADSAYLTGHTIIIDGGRSMDAGR